MRPTVPPRVAVVAAAGLMAVAVIGAAATRSWTLEPRNFGSFHFGFGNDFTPDPLPTLSRDEDEPSSGSSGGHIVQTLFQTFLVLAAAAVLGLVAWRLWLLWQRFQRTAAPPEAAQAQGAGSMAMTDAEPELPPLLTAAHAALQALEDVRDSDDAVVAAWLAVENGAAASGIARHPAQTTTEFTVTVLSRTAAEPESIGTLRSLYLQARFSDHRLTAADVDAARRSLRDLADSWATAIETTTAASIAADHVVKAQW